MGFNKGILLALLAVLLVALAGCATPSGGGPAEPTESYRIGFVAPLTGNTQWYGEWQLKAIQLGVDEINSTGGIKGQRLEIVAEDDQCLPKLGTEAMQRLASAEKVPLVLGAYCSSVCMAMAPVAEANKVVMVNVCNTDKLREAGDYIFRVKPGASQEGKFMAEIIRRKGRAETLALLYINNEYGASTKDVVKREFEGLGGKIAAEEAFEQGSGDFRSQLAKVKEARPDAVYLVGYAKENGLMLRQARELGLTQTFYSSLTLESPDFLAVAGEAAEGVVYPYLYDPQGRNPLTQEYNTKFRAAYGVDSEMWGALYYDALWMLKPILEKCGKDSACIKDELYKVKGFEGVTGLTGFDEKGDIVKPYLLKEVRNGKFVARAE